MLVDIAMKTKGKITPCKMVHESSRKYRNREDHITEFIDEKIEVDPKGKIRKEEIANEFNIGLKHRRHNICHDEQTSIKVIE